MKQINREAIQRMVNAQANSYQSGGSGEGGSMAGYATQVWVEGNYLSKEFFNKLFTIHGTDANDDPTTVLPNDMDTTIVSIESMFGFWTEFYLSALGQGSGGSTAITLSMLDDVQLTNPTSGQVLTYNGTKWVNADSSGGIDIGAVWTALAAGTSEQINASHLTTALADYVTIATDQSITGTKTFSSVKLTEDIPEDTDMPFFLGINLFRQGGIVRWTRAADAKVGYASAAGSVAWDSIFNKPNVMTTDTAQTISGAKTFSDIRVNNIPENTSMSFFLGINAFNQGGVVQWTKAADATVGNATTAASCSGNSATATKLKTAHSIWGQSFDGSADISGNMSSVGNISFSASGKNIGSVAYFDTTNKQLGIGQSSPSYKLDVSGVIHASTGILSNGYVTALSDIRMKNVKSRFEIDPLKIAGASLIRFEWKDGHDRNVHVGGIAQEWDEILPESVIRTGDGMLAMDYGTIGMACAVSLARKVVEQDRRIEQLEKRIERLERIL